MNSVLKRADLEKKKKSMHITQKDASSKISVISKGAFSKSDSCH